MVDLLRKGGELDFTAASARRSMSRTPARKRGEDGRLLPLEEAQPDQGPGPDNFGEGVWEAGEDFGSVGPAAFGTPEQQASIADLQAFQTEVQAEQAKAREAAEASGLRVEQLSEDVRGITSQLATARACDVFRAVEAGGLTRAAFEELRRLHELQVKRLRCLLAKCKARQGTGWKSAEQVQRDWDEVRFDNTFMPYLSDAERAERKEYHRNLRAAETHQLAKVTASQRVADRLAAQKRRNAEAAKRKAAQGGGA